MNLLEMGLCAAMRRELERQARALGFDDYKLVEVGQYDLDLVCRAMLRDAFGGGAVRELSHGAIVAAVVSSAPLVAGLL